ncbi:UbiX family flavin prenyltransferase [Dissulfuribacter thermophilus]|uniref:UbiX family flavin prenyltransferase n=1 Tax=Dissulfuribacter thermophilus TaxID=1156395 RepID=UPI00082A2320|nr:UbiX family flavin prenyltransferase [Dissulfuribacter thermophilus]
MHFGQSSGSKPLPILLGVTGASGSIYALKFMELSLDLGLEVHVIISRAGREVVRYELGDEGYDKLVDLSYTVYQEDDLTAPPASGSSLWHAMVVLPCTMGTLSAVANGASRNLIHRACDCFLKERRPLVLAVREAPFNLIHLRNMTRAAEAGAVIYPCMPSFYHGPKTLDHMAEFLAGRIIEFLGIRVEGLKRWNGTNDYVRKFSV